MHPKDILYNWGGLNERLFYAINKIHTPLIDSFMLLGTKLGNYKLFPVYMIAIAAIMLVQSKRLVSRSPADYAHYRSLCIETLLVLCVAFAFSCIWVHLLKDWFHFPRPFAALPEGSVHILDSVRKGENPNASFPSGHTEFATLMVAGLWPMLNRRLRDAGILFFIWVTFSRLSLGVHFPADIFYTALLSLSAVILVRYCVHKGMTQWKRRKSTIS